MNDRKRKALVIGAIAFLCIGLALIQVGIHKGRSLALADTDTAAVDRLRADLVAARFDAEVERQKLAIILCESDARHHGTWGDGGRSYGIAQFQYATFNELRKEAGRPELRWKDRDDQLWLLDWALRHGYGEKWTCFDKTIGAGLKPAPTRYAKGGPR